jgi:putative endonuclease
VRQQWSKHSFFKRARPVFEKAGFRWQRLPDCCKKGSIMKTKDSTADKQEWCVYILRCADNSLYTGITNNLEKRLAAHASGTASKYTRSRRPASLAAASGKLDKASALRLEMQIKKLPKALKIEALETSE